MSERRESVLAAVSRLGAMVELTDEHVQSQRRDLVDLTARLIEFLRDLASSGRPRIRDLDRYEQVLWLCDLPTQTVMFREARPGQVLVSFDPVPSEPPPAVPPVLRGWLDPDVVGDSSREHPPPLAQRGPITVEVVEPSGSRRITTEEGDLEDAYDVLAEYQRWAATWAMWARHDRTVRNRRRWYEDVSRIAHRLSQQDDQFELVVATGLLSWQPPSGVPVRNHVLTTRAVTAVDQDTGRVDIVVAPDVTTRVNDRELLDGEVGFEATRAEAVRTRLRGEEFAPLSDQTKLILEDWRRLALDRCRPYRHDERPPSDAATEAADLSFAPALVLRPRDSKALVDYYDQMLEVLSGPDAEAPLSLAQLVTALSSDERRAWLDAEGAPDLAAVGADPLFPLPANPQQRQIMGQLLRENGVVVQGPPGTGKTHTIANLTAALLAQGQRVLVTSQKAQALRVLRDKLPEQVQELCVSMTDIARGGSQELSKSVNALSQRFSSFNPTAQHDLEMRLTGERAATLARIAKTREGIRALREAETYQHPRIAPGYGGTLAAIAGALRRGDPRFGWMPTPLPDPAGERPPLTADEAAELRRLLQESTPQRRSRATQVLPDPSAYPAVSEVRGLIADEKAAARAAAEVENDLSRQLTALDSETFAAVKTAVGPGVEALRALPLGPEPADWDPADWRVAAVSDGLARRNGGLWSQLAGVATEAANAHDQLGTIGLRTVVLPDFPAAGPDSAAAQLAAARALRDHLAGGGHLKKHLRSAVQKRAEFLLAGSAVDGGPIASGALLDLVIARVSAQVTVETLAGRWALVGATLDPGPVERQVAQLVDMHTDLRQVGGLLAARDHVERHLATASSWVRLDTADGWIAFVGALNAVSARLDAEAATAALDNTSTAIDLTARATSAPPELHELARAVEARDPTLYEQALQALADAQTQQRDERRCADLRQRLHVAHPGFAGLLERTCGDHQWDERLGVLPEAWNWGRAKTFFDAQRDPGREQRLEAELADAVARAERLTADLATTQAWTHCLARMNAAQAQALHSFRLAMTNRGKGTGKFAAQHERAAREAMHAARGAVPAWIMPLAQVLDTMPAERNSFDVVIVDEASQASIEALFLLWLAPRVIVVGDDRQCTPSQVSHGALQPIFDKLESYLQDVPHYLRVAFTPQSSLFSLLSTRFGQVIRLQEHFRCMPEIIDWSSRQFYSDSPLVPLRQFGADRLAPLRCRYVPGAVTEGSSTRLRNQAEAEAIVSQLAACVTDPDYDRRTFGVVVLQGAGQVRLIDDLIRQTIPADEIERRRIRVGAPPDFQGDERNVVFLSMVAAERRTAVTSMEWQRRFNVAASRAQDQMWLFHSVTPDLLSPTDLRRSLLSYMINPPAPMAGRDLSDVAADEPHPEFDSLFEQRVFRKIRDRGYHVTPQVEANGRRIDLVVTGLKGRLAVECDGDFWHTTPDQVTGDLDREQELKRAGWRFWRVRQSEFDFDQDQALASLWSELERRGIRPHEVEEQADDPATAKDWEATTLSAVEGFDGLDGADPSELDEPIERRSAIPAQRTRPRGTDSAQPLFSHQRSAGEMATTLDVREWARAHGMPVADRGRLAVGIVTAYNRVHPDRPYRG